MIDSEARLRRMLSCLGEPSRFRLVRQLMRGNRCVSDLALKVGLSQSCTTRHLQALQRERLVCGTREGKRVIFSLSLDEPQTRELLAWAMSGPPPAPGRRGRAAGRAAVSKPRPVRRVPRAAPQSNPAPAQEAPEEAHVRRRPPREEIEDYLL